MGQNVADLILEQLAAYGITRIYGVIGDAVFPLADALARQSRVQYVPCGIETAASFIASAAAKLTGRIGVCIGTSGPGAANLVNGTAEAFLDGAPLLCLTGQVPGDKLGTLSKQDIDLNRLFGGITAKSRLCVHPDTALPIVNELLETALQFRTAVHLAIPKNVLAGVSTVKISTPVFPYSLQGSGIVQGDLEKLGESCRNCQKPVVMMGKESRPYAKELYQLADALSAGIILTQEGKGIIPDTDPLVLGGIGEAYLPECWNEMDLMLVFGGATYEKRFFPAQTEVWNIDPVPLGNVANPRRIIGDFGPVISKLAASPNPDRTPWRYRISNAHHVRLNHVTQLSADQPGAFCRLLSEIMNPDAICTLDVGEFVYWFNLCFLGRQQTILHSTQWRSMGCGIPAAIAASLERPDRQVAALVGDGGFLMSISELSTVARYRLPLIICTLTNRSFGLESQKMMKENYAAFGTDLLPPDCVKLAESFGIPGFRLDNISSGKDILRDALRQAPALIEVPVSSPPLPHL